MAKEIDWEIACQGVPTYDLLDDNKVEEADADIWRVFSAAEGFIWEMEKGYYLTWEAIVREEQGLELSEEQEESLQGLLSFSDEAHERVLYVDEFARPRRPWYVTFREIARRLLRDPFNVTTDNYDRMTEWWPMLVDAIEEYGQGLSLPLGTKELLDVVSEELRHKLWLESCFDALMGSDIVSINEEEERWRVEELVELLRECKDSVAYLELTLSGLHHHLVVPDGGWDVLERALLEELSLPNANSPLADCL